MMVFDGIGAEYVQTHRFGADGANADDVHDL